MTANDYGLVWLLFLVIGTGTFLIRFSFIYFFGKREVPGLAIRLLRFVPAAVLTALITPAILIPETFADISLSNERLPAAVIAASVSLLTKNALATIGSGMAALWILQYFLP